VELLPEFEVLDLASLRPFAPPPPPGLPLRQPFAQSFGHVLTIGDEFDMARSLQRLQSADRGDEFHPVVGCDWLTARLTLPLAGRQMLQDVRPAARSWVTTASAVREKPHFKLAHRGRAYRLGRTQSNSLSSLASSVR